MLDRLPNEILVKIFSKVKSNTVTKCQLLSSRFNATIRRFGLHKNLKKLRINFNTDRDRLTYQFFATIKSDEAEHQLNLERINFDHLAPSEILPSMLAVILRKFHRIEEFEFGFVRINDSLLGILMKSTSFTWAKRICFKSIMDVSNEKFDEFLNHLGKLEGFMVSTAIMSKTIFVHLSPDSVACTAGECRCIREELIPYPIDTSKEELEDLIYDNMMDLDPFIDPFHNIVNGIDINGKLQPINLPESTINLINYNYRHIIFCRSIFSEEDAALKLLRKKQNVDWRNDRIGVVRSLDMAYLREKLIHITLQKEN